MNPNQHNVQYSAAMSNQAQAGGFNQLGAAITPVNPSFVSSIDGALVCCEQTAMRVEKVVERLCGPVPTEDGSTEGMRPGGLLDAAENQGSMIRSLSRRMNAALDYLESKLP